MNNEKSFVQISKIKKDIKNKIWKWIRSEKNLYIYDYYKTNCDYNSCISLIYLLIFDNYIIL